MPSTKNRIAFENLSEFEQEMVLTAWDASENAYAPYSNFPVGASLLARNADGETRIFTGCNVECAAFYINCAERTACYKAISEGFRDLVLMALVCAKNPDIAGFPCGSCRQVLREFNLQLPILVVVSKQNDVIRTTVEELLPNSFGPENLGK
jgi:cytidine deaminase